MVGKICDDGIRLKSTGQRDRGNRRGTRGTEGQKDNAVLAVSILATNRTSNFCT
jgi:hypothetical protein